jgi:phosphoribosylanthranilate isomerase
MDASDYKVKLCGTASVEDALLAQRHGADYIGVVLEVDFSERSRSVAQAQTMVEALSTPVVILTFNRSVEWVVEAFQETGAAAVQLLGQEPPDAVAALKRHIGGEVWKSLYLPPVEETSDSFNLSELRRQMNRYAVAGADRLLLDTAAFVGGKHRFGGTGRTSDWNLARRLILESPLPTFLSGGITPENVAQACREIQPYGVDLCSGVESERGRRDPTKTAALFEALRGQSYTIV